MKLNELVEMCQSRLEKSFSLYLENPSPAPDLQKAMRYAVLNGGKRIRPLFVYATGYAFEAQWENCDAAACAIEFIHTYSLIHDDLPAMDNADLRRGEPSCHKAFNEATAILAGDALQTLAFDVLATHPAALLPEQRLAMIHTLTHASGLYGMAGGQMLDLSHTQSLLEMYNLKTGALLVASIMLGAIAADIKDPSLLDALKIYAYRLGTAFQLQDDLLDYEQSVNTGKPQGLDKQNLKLTYPMQIGYEQTKKEIKELFESALAAITYLGNKREIFIELANMLLQREK